MLPLSEVQRMDSFVVTRLPSFGRRAEGWFREVCRRGSTPMFVDGLRDLNRAKKSSLAVRRAGGGIFGEEARRGSIDVMPKLKMCEAMSR